MMRAIFVLCAIFFPATSVHADIAKKVVLERVLQFWDSDSDGTIRVAELETIRTNIFSAFDSDLDGIWDSEEYEKYALGLEKHRSKMDLQVRLETEPLKNSLTWEFNDKNSDGLVDSEEFIEGVEFWFSFLDTNLDRVISLDDVID